ncbi:hypothetical protein AARAC_005137 [Aspergillus arachidicola]|uniref:FAD-binding PCMH-type domain-containing protein n=1 Tax=Aspergillus arachidicola TaxID=656916 RepID=A0A2G7FQ80_9EURO|nr:hypothetical protein AARAC_005137 [Aspergillus arachidicola]
MAALPSVAAIVNGANLDPKTDPKSRPSLNNSPIYPQLKGTTNMVQAHTKLSIKSPWSTACWLRPRVVVLPRSAQQVGPTLSLCRFFSIKFSIHGGGHSPSIGWNSNDGGVVISLAAFDQVNLSEDKLTADIGVGLRWLDVYKALDHYDLVVAGGRFPMKVVSDLRYVVLANVEIVNANAKQNSDLFWALKGGGSSFGIVTKIDMKTVPAKVWSEAKVYAPSVMPELLQALMKHHEAIERDEKSSLILTCNNQDTMLVSFYCDPVDKLPAAFEPFEHIPATSRSLTPGRILRI